MNAVNANRALVGLTAVAWVLQLVYLVVPFDLLPDLVPVIGWLDDLFGLAGTVSLTGYTILRLMEAGEQITDEHPDYEPVETLALRTL